MSAIRLIINLCRREVPESDCAQGDEGEVDGVGEGPRLPGAEQLWTGDIFWYFPNKYMGKHILRIYYATFSVLCQVFL